MSYRIIDQTESTEIIGTESIPGTQQTSTGETTPKNVRWVWNTALAWMIEQFEASASFLAWIVSSLIASSSFKTGLQDIGICNTITSSFFEIADVNLQYVTNQYEFVETIILKGIASGSTATVEYYTLNLTTGLYELNSITMQDSNVLNILNYFDSSTSSERKITITPSADCTIIIKSVKGL